MKKTEFYRLRPIIYILAVLFTGWLTGSVIGVSCIKEKLYNDTGTFFFYRPAGGYIDIYRLINSPDPLERLSGYYAVTPLRAKDIDFLIERFNDETELIHRRTIIWLLGFSADKERAVKFLQEIYPDQNLKIKLEIKSSLERLGHAQN